MNPFLLEKHIFQIYPLLTLSKFLQVYTIKSIRTLNSYRGAKSKMPNIRIPTPLRVYTENEAQVEADGATVGELLHNLVVQYPDLEQHLFNEGKLRSFVNVFIGDEDIRFLDGVDTEVDANEDVRIIPSIAGGR
jgi:molybdopterin converting factor small subunit